MSSNTPSPQKVSQTADQFTYSVIIPVFNSEKIVRDTVQRTEAFFQAMQWRCQIILVNDGSGDGSWEAIAECALNKSNVVAINLLRNYGQHTAVFCGLKHATGDFMITIDDDLQNPPEEIVHLVAKILEGYDVVFGRFRQKQHARFRRLGSRAITCLNRWVFSQPRELQVTNFRIFKREIATRMLVYHTSFPFINGLALMFSSKRANVWVNHMPRRSGRSNYGFTAVLALIGRILFNYSAFPLRLFSLIGFCATFVAGILGVYFFVHALLYGTRVAGWASTIILISFLSGINIAITSMVGEYLVRLLKQSSCSEAYQVQEIIGSNV